MSGGGDEASLGGRDALARERPSWRRYTVAYRPETVAVPAGTHHDQTFPWRKKAITSA